MDLFKDVSLGTVSIPVDGIEGGVEVHRFSWEEFEQVQKKIDGVGLEIAILYFLHKFGYEHSDEDATLVRQKIGLPQIKQIYFGGLKANGIDVPGDGKGLVAEAKKS